MGGLHQLHGQPLPMFNSPFCEKIPCDVLISRSKTGRPGYKYKAGDLPVTAGVCLKVQYLTHRALAKEWNKDAQVNLKLLKILTYQ